MNPKKRTEQNTCENDFCKKYSEKASKIFTPLNKTIRKKQKTSIRKSCRLFYCNPGCKGTLMEKGKQMPRLDPLLTKENPFYNKQGAKEFRKKWFGNKRDVLVDDVYQNVPPNIKKNFKKKGSLSICEPFIPNGSLELINKNL
jgi:hypothetical protein